MRERDKTVIAVIHDLNLALSVADAVFVMKRGRLAAQGAPGEAAVQSAIEQSFGVRLEHVETPSGVAWVPFERRCLATLRSAKKHAAPRAALFRR